MFRMIVLAAATLAAIGLSGCANPHHANQTGPLAFGPQPQPDITVSDSVMGFPGPRKGLAGRTLQVESLSDIQLGPHEVVITFDDGPLPHKTEAILDALDAHEVKATFLMVGTMAKSYPALVREVAARGHAIGTHTQSHANLTSLNFDSAMAEIAQGRQSVAAALIPTGFKAAPFFRFPYLADTPRLRNNLANRGIVVIDVDVDSKDYFVSTPDQVRHRTIARLEQRGSGIILLHDLHQRTVAMLPKLLDDLHARGYKVVNLQPAHAPADALIAAALVN